MNSYRGGVATRGSNTWTQSTSATGLPVMLKESQRQIRDRARQLDRNNALASSVLDRCVENVVGTGITIEPATESKEFNDEAAEIWRKWQRRCDIRGLFDFCTLQQLIYRSQKRDGDVAVLLVDRGGFPFLQCIEGDYIESPYGKINPSMIDGVEVSSVGAPVRFWIRVQDPNNYAKVAHTSVSPRDLVFLNNADRLDINCIRGVSQFAQGFELFDQISGYLEGSVLSAKIASYLSLIITRNNASGIVGNFGTHTNSAGETVRKKTWEPGQIQYLEPGEDVKTVLPNQPTQNFPDAIAAFARFVGLKFGLTIEQVLLDFSRTNYSSARAARLQAQQTADMEQRRFACNFVCRVYEWVISKSVKQGLFTAAVPEVFLTHEWIPQGRPWVDPSKEIDFAERAIALGIDARSYIARGMGYEFIKLCEQNQKDRELMEEHELPVDAPEKEVVRNEEKTHEPNDANKQ